MKLIDVLDKIANDELQEGTEIYAKKGLNNTWFKYHKNSNKFNRERIAKILEIGVDVTDEVEIKEPNKKIEHIYYANLYTQDIHSLNEWVNEHFNEVYNKIYELIDEVNKRNNE